MEDEERILYAIWLNRACGHYPRTIAKVLERYGSAEEAFATEHYHGDFCKILGVTRMLKLERTLDGAKRMLEECYKQEIQVILKGSKPYPKQLESVEHPPNILYAKGRLPDGNQMLGISVVGTRNATQDGETMAQMLGKSLAESGGTVISGMARGIDGAAHCGALEAGGTTVAVLAGGVDVIYPTEHTELYYHILEHGGVVSEQPPGVKGRPQFYQDRNRIIVGLSYGTVVVEGEKKSGTAISARIATESNRDVFAVPGNPLNPQAELPNALIRDGAKQVVGPLDVVEEYVDLYPEKLEYGLHIRGKAVVGRVRNLNHPHGIPVLQEKESMTPTVQEQKYQLETMLKNGDYRQEEVQILRYLSEHIGMVSFDDLAEGCGIETGALSSMLIILQMKKAIVQSAGGQYGFQFSITE